MCISKPVPRSQEPQAEWLEFSYEWVDLNRALLGATVKNLAIEINREVNFDLVPCEVEHLLTKDLDLLYEFYFELHSGIFGLE